MVNGVLRVLRLNSSMAQLDKPSDTAQKPAAQAGDHYRLSPELVTKLRAALDAQAESTHFKN